MLLLFRFLAILFQARFRPRIGGLDESVVRFTVLPHDSDLNFHLNAGRYVSFTDIARVELLARMRVLSKMVGRGWRPLAGGMTMRFRRSILPFQRFQIRSRILGWDDKWFYFEHVVERHGLVCAIGHVRLLIRGPEGNVTPPEVISAMGLEPAQSPRLPDFVAQWRDAEDAR